ncbi:MAG: hypothetical protein JO041_07050 [Acidobacteria bacterium]|nr:hypothetical protein [Acidobacteriota bacterium]
MAISILALHALLSLVIIRALCFRATLGWRALAAFLAYGFVAGPIAAGSIEHFVSPYGWNFTSQWAPTLVALVTSGALMLALLLPVLSLLRHQAIRSSLSAADIFLAAFLAGYGFDLQQSLFASMNPGSPLTFSMLPPGLVETTSATAACFAYLCAFPALVLSAGRRWLPDRKFNPLLLALGIVISGAVYAADTMAAGNQLGGTLLGGEWPYWAMIAALLAAQALEARAVPQGTPGAMGEWRAAMAALFSGDWSGSRAAAGRYRHALRRQLAPPSSNSPNPATGQPSTAPAVPAPAGVSKAQPAARVSALMAWVRAHRLQAALVFFAAALVFMPGLPWLEQLFWTGQVPAQGGNYAVPVVHWVVQWLHMPLTESQLSTVSLALLAIVLWRYITAAGAPLRRNDVDLAARYAGERGTLMAAMILSVLAIVYGHLEQLYRAGGQIAWLAGARFSNLPPSGLPTEALAFAAVATGIALQAADRWRRAPLELRRRSAITRALHFCALLLGAWAVFAVVGPVESALHGCCGASLFRWFGGNGNSAGDVLIGLFTVAVAYGIFRGIRSGVAHLLAYFSTDGRPALAPRARAANG